MTSFFAGHKIMTLQTEKRGSKEMKRTVTLLLIALMIFTLSACQQTPEKVIVQGKDLDKLIENATKEQPDGFAQGETISDKIGAEKTYSKELADANGKVAIHVNAQVVVPDAKEVSVQKVERGTFSQETVDVLREHLVKGELFAGGDDMLTKDDIRRQILAIEQLVAQKQTLNRNGEFDPNIESGELDYLKKKLETAPDTRDETPISGKLEPFEDGIYSAGERLLGLAQSDQGGYESLTVYNDYKSSVNLLVYTSEKNTFSANMGDYITKEAAGPNSFPTSTEIASIPGISITKEGAQQQADALVAALGIDYLTCYSIEKAYGGSRDEALRSNSNPLKCVWFIRYVRKVNEIPVTYTAYDCMSIEENSQSAPWSYEDMTFAIDDNGIVGFRWSSPYKFTEVVTENSNLLTFKDITDVFDTMSLAVNAWDGPREGNPNLTGIEINVDEIRFGLTRVTEENKRDSGLLIPVWDFFGTMTYIQEANGQPRKTDIGYIPILTVNAIDGTIIDRSLGY
jgi:hypothetical protein